MPLLTLESSVAQNAKTSPNNDDPDIAEFLTDFQQNGSRIDKAGCARLVESRP